MTNYDTFGHWYDVAVGERPELADFADRIIRSANPRARTLLELGCGSGSLLKRFSKRYKVSGVDLSPKMIELARKRVPKADVRVGDISKIELGQKFDAVVCLFDTMNHLTSFDQWKGVFAVAAKHLAPGGVFVFDVNTEYKLERYRTEPPFAEFHDGAISIISVTRPKPSRYTVTLAVFEHKGAKQFQLHELKVPELVISREKITRELEKVFGRIAAFDPERKRAGELTEELFFRCQHPKAEARLRRISPRASALKT